MDPRPDGDPAFASATWGTEVQTSSGTGKGSLRSTPTGWVGGRSRCTTTGLAGAAFPASESTAHGKKASNG
jgi:hypothetical protein